METKIKKHIKESYYYPFNISKAGLAAIFISARCKSKKQLKSNVDGDLRIEINKKPFREFPPEKNIQLFNIPAAFNGSKLKGLKKTVILLTILEREEHTISLIPNKEAFVEDIEIKEMPGLQNIEFDLKEKSEDGNNRPWIVFILNDLPLSQLSAEVILQKRLWDSDDVKVIINGKTKKNIQGGKFKFWYFMGGALGWLIPFMRGKSEKRTASFNESLDSGLHYIEFWSDRMPILNKVGLSLRYVETNAEKRAGKIIKDNVSIIKQAAKEFNVDPALVGAMIYQEQSTNVNFVDTLADYIGGLMHVNTSIGIGQVRVKTAESLEKIYSELYFPCKNSLFIDCIGVRVEYLKDPFFNVRYVAAKIKFSQDRWKNAGFDIQNMPDILGTLYNIEDVENPIEPHFNPEANEFGKGVKKNFNKVKELLNL